MNNDMQRFSVRVTARRINRRNLIFKTILIILLISVCLLAVGYGLSMFVNKVGHFTVLVPPENGALTLSNTEDFEESKTYIEAEILPSMDNITKSWLPTDIDLIDGSHNGDNYIAHTFYLKNTSDEAIDYKAEINLLSSTLGADEAVRVMVFKNGEETVYAKPQVDSNEPEPDTVAFAARTKVMSETNQSFESGAVDKYTVVIWLEGEDPECVDNIKGGVVKMSMDFQVLDDTAFT